MQRYGAPATPTGAQPQAGQAVGAQFTAQMVRDWARAGLWEGPTRGAAMGHVQCNVAILPGAAAEDFARWCELNPAVAPVLARTLKGSPLLPELGNIDLRYDLPRYVAFRDGKAAGEIGDLADEWTEDLVGFAFGCSFSLEEVLRLEGIPLDYEARGFGGAIYETSLPTVEHRGFSGPIVASMRPIPADAVNAAVAVSERYPQLHGKPVHVGDPAAIGVSLEHPLQSLGPLSVAHGEVPVFWACGVTTQRVIEQARPDRAYAHVSACMLVCDARLEDLALVTT